MALSYNLGYQESISVHPTRRQNFAGKPYSTFPNISEWVILTSNLVKNQFSLFCLSGSSVSFRQIICSLYITPTFHTLRPTLTERSELSLRIKMWHQQSCRSNLFCFLASHKLQWPWKSGDIFLIVFRQFDRPLDCVYWKMNIYPKIHHCHWPLQCIGFFCLYRG